MKLNKHDRKFFMVDKKLEMLVNVCMEINTIIFQTEQVKVKLALLTHCLLFQLLRRVGQEGHKFKAIVGNLE